MDGLYPYSSPIILTDSIFENYGGHTGTSSAAMRQAAYTIAEERVSQAIGSFLLPTIVTGTQYFHPDDPYLQLEYGYISKVVLIRFIDTKEEIYYTISGTANVYASLRDANLGLVDLHRVWGNCQCSSSARPWPYQVQIIYEAGLPTGVASTHPNFLLALTAYADIVLNELLGYGNEAVGDIGIQEYRNQGYSEKRYPLKDTDFGSSARANFVRKLLDKWIKPRFLRL